MSTANRTTRAADPAAAGTQRHTVTHTEKGISLARGPALILGTILTAVGLYLLYKAHTFPKFASFPNGHAHQDGKFLFGIFGANGWTGMLTAVAGGLLLFGAAQHLLAKTMSLIVGVVLAAAAIIGFTSSGNVVGMAAANHLTELGWAISAVILLFNTLIPRRTRTVEAVGAPVAGAPLADDEVARRRGGLPPERARRHEVEGGVAAGAAGVAVAEHEHRKHEREGAVDDPAAAEGRGEGEHRHLGRDAALAGGAVAVAEHEHHKHEREREAQGPVAAEGRGEAGRGVDDREVTDRQAGSEDPTVAHDRAGAQPADGQRTDVPPSDGQVSETQAVEPQPSEAQPAETGTHRSGGLIGRLTGHNRES